MVQDKTILNYLNYDGNVFTPGTKQDWSLNALLITPFESFSVDKTWKEFAWLNAANGLSNECLRNQLSNFCLACGLGSIHTNPLSNS